MTHPYNIHPLALSPQHYLLARAGYVISPLGIRYSLNELISVKTGFVKTINSTYLVLTGTLTSIGEEESLNVYFNWGIDDNYGNTSDEQELTQAGSFSQTVYEISAGETYNYQAVAYNKNGYAFGENKVVTVPEYINNFTINNYNLIDTYKNDFYLVEKIKNQNKISFLSSTNYNTLDLSTRRVQNEIPFPFTGKEPYFIFREGY